MPQPLCALLENLTSDRLKAYRSVLTADKKATCKADIAKVITAALQQKVPELWQQLDDLEKMAVSEAGHSDNGALDKERFRAKYGRLPKHYRWTGMYNEKPPAFAFFF